MTKLAVAPSLTLNIHQPPAMATLRNQAFWHPDIPDTSLFIREQGLPSVTYFTKKYRPIRWVHFGGPGGEYLRHITKMDVAVQSLPFRFSFEFHYGGLSVPREHARLSMRPSNVPEPTELEEFLIDGSHGEVVKDIAVYVRIRDDYAGPDGQGFEAMDPLSKAENPTKRWSRGGDTGERDFPSRHRRARD